MTIALVGLLLVLCVATGGADYAPTPKPRELSNCPLDCVERLECVGYPTCNAECVKVRKLDVPAAYISPDLADDCVFDNAARDRRNWLQP